MKTLNRKNHKLISVKALPYLHIFLLLLILLAGISSVSMAQQPEAFKKSIQIINPRPDFSLSVRLDKGVGASYTQGERIRVYFRTNQNAYVSIFGYDSRGNIRLLFPNQYQRNHLVEANRQYQIDGIIEPGTPPGIEYIQGFATTEPTLVSRDLERRLEKEEFPKIEEGTERFTQRMKGILIGLPSSKWAGSETLHYQVVERRRTGQLRVNSSPEGAEVFLDDRYLGRTLLVMDGIQIGEYTVRLEQSGYHSWSRTIQIRSNRTEYIAADLEQIQRYGTIAIQSNIRDARIYIDGQLAGSTQKDSTVLLERIQEGSHSIWISLEGYIDWSTEINVRSNQHLQLTVNLERILQTGTLEITSNISSVRIYLDGNYYGQTSSSQSVRLQNIEEGTYTLRVTREGYQDYTDTINIYPDYIYHKHVQMRPQYQKSPLFSDINIVPETVNLKSNSQWITAYIALSENYQVQDIDFDTVRAWHEGKSIPAEWGDIQNKRLMVKFSGNAFRNLFSGSAGYASVRVSGELHDGTRFEGSDEIRVIRP
jgi:hypothetical protein